MSENSKIEWTDHTFNPWRGCARVSTGCTNCYAERQARRNPAVLGEWGAGKRVIASKSYWQQPIRWEKKARQEGQRYRVFCGSMMDVFEDQPELEEPRNKLLTMIFATPHLDWLLLTKRPENAQDLCWKKWRAGIPENVWMGVSIEDAEHLGRLEHLRRIPAATRFVSFEPLLSDMGRLDLAGIDWVIVGGESGPKARPMHPAWVRSIRDHCKAAGVPFFFKQWGEWLPGEPSTTRLHTYDRSDNGMMYCTDGRRLRHDWPDKTMACKVGKKAADRLLDGNTWDEMPECRRST